MRGWFNHAAAEDPGNGDGDEEEGVRGHLIGVWRNESITICCFYAREYPRTKMFPGEQGAEFLGLSQRKNLLKERTQNDQPGRCPNRISCGRCSVWPGGVLMVSSFATMVVT